MEEHCSYCKSKIFESDRNCFRCGAPTGKSLNLITIPTKQLITRKDIFDEYNSLSNYVENILPEMYVKVISLIPYKLNLSTDGYGRDKVFSFLSTPQSQMIQYQDLIKILENQRRFAEAGFYLIMNKTVVNNHNLNECYEKILSQEEYIDV